MEKICLLEAGSFLVAVDNAVIVRTQNSLSFLAGELERNTPVVHLESFFLHTTARVLNPDSLIVEVTARNKYLALLVDRKVEEIPAPEHFEELPLLYPSLARRCCPQIILHHKRAALLLNVAEIMPVLKEMEQRHGLFTIPMVMKKMKQQPGEPSDKGTKKESTGSAEKIISWAIKEYKNRKAANLPTTLTVDDVPIQLRQGTGLGKEQQQYLLDQVVKRARGV